MKKTILLIFCLAIHQIVLTQSKTQMANFNHEYSWMDALFKSYLVNNCFDDITGGKINDERGDYKSYEIKSNIPDWVKSDPIFHYGNIEKGKSGSCTLYLAFPTSKIKGESYEQFEVIENYITSFLLKNKIPYSIDKNTTGTSGIDEVFYLDGSDKRKINLEISVNGKIDNTIDYRIRLELYK